MLLFGHTGITLGVAVILSGVLTKGSLPHTDENTAEPIRDFSETHSGQNVSSVRASWLTFLRRHVDVRLLLIGSLLPDIIDKPIGQFFLRDTYSNGRIFCHTIVFLIIIALVGLWLYRSYRKTWLLVLSFGVFTHFIFDQMWLNLQTLLWPLYGLAFKKVALTHWLQNTFHALQTDLTVYVPELVGAVVLTWFAFELVRKRKVFAFVRSGSF